MTRLGAADHDDVGAAQPDHVEAERDRLVAGGAGRHRACAPRPGAPSRRPTFAAGAFAISIGMVNGLTRRAPFSFWMSQLPSRVCRPPMPVAMRHAEPVPVDRVLLAEPEAGVLQASLAATTRQLGRAVEPARLDPVDHLGRVDRDLAPRSSPAAPRPSPPDRADAGPAGQQAGPGGGEVAAEWGGGAEAGDDDGSRSCVLLRARLVIGPAVGRPARSAQADRWAYQAAARSM